MSSRPASVVTIGVGETTVANGDASRPFATNRDRDYSLSMRARAGSVDDNYAKFRNDYGAPEIVIGLKQFKCIGVSPPHDHPHIYLDMGDDDTILCPYCAVLFRYDPSLNPGEAVPPDCSYTDI